MSKKSVKKLLREQRQQRRRDIREQERTAKAEAAQAAADARAQLRAEEREEKRRVEEEKRQAETQKREAQAAERRDVEAQRRRAAEDKRAAAEEKKAEAEKKAAAAEKAEAEKKAAAAEKAQAAKEADAAEKQAGAEAGPDAEVDRGRERDEERADKGAAAAVPAAAAPAADAPAAVSEAERGSDAGATPDANERAAAAAGAGGARDRAGAQAGPWLTRRSTARAGAVLVSAGLLAAGLGSATYEAYRPAAASEDSASAAVASVPAPETSTELVCPPMPGQPDSLSTDGLLQYRDRDDSASSRFQGLVFADSAGEMPASSWFQLNQSQLTNQRTLSSADEAQGSGSESGDPIPIAERDILRETTTGDMLSRVLEIEPGAEGEPIAADAQSHYIADEGPVSGLAVSDCAAPQRNQWFFGPELAAGSSSLLTLANPEDRAATVTVSTFDTDGDRGSNGARTLVVPAETVRSVNLAALAPSSADLGVLVSSSGAPVAASVQASRTSGLTGLGVEFLPGLEAPATTHVMPGVPMPDSSDADSSDAGAALRGEIDGPTADLWVHAPGDSRTTVEVQVYGPEGQVELETPGVFTVEPGEIDRITLLGVDAGTYDVDVTTDNPAYVAVRTDGEDPGSQADAEDAEDSDSTQGDVLDFSWATPVQPLTQGSGTLLPQAGDASVSLRAEGEAAQTGYRVIDAEGEVSDVVEVEVPAGESQRITSSDLDDAASQSDLDDPVGILFEPDASGAPVYATLETSDDDGRFSLSRIGTFQDPGQSVPVRLRQ